MGNIFLSLDDSLDDFGTTFSSRAIIAYRKAPHGSMHYVSHGLAHGRVEASPGSLTGFIIRFGPLQSSPH